MPAISPKYRKKRRTVHLGRQKYYLIGILVCVLFFLYCCFSLLLHNSGGAQNWKNEKHFHRSLPSLKDVKRIYENKVFSHTSNSWIRFADGAPPGDITTWEEAPPQRYSHAAAVVDSKLYVSHGYYSSWEPMWLEDTWSFDISSGTWQNEDVNHSLNRKLRVGKNIDRPTPRYCHTMSAELGGQSILLFGGQGHKMHHAGDSYATGEDAGNDVWRLHLPVSGGDSKIQWERLMPSVAVKSFTSSIPMGRYFHATTLVYKTQMVNSKVRSFMYTLGGQGDRRRLQKSTIDKITKTSGKVNEFTNRLGDFWQLDLESFRWTRLESPFSSDNPDAGIHAHSMVTIERIKQVGDSHIKGNISIIVFGGSIRRRGTDSEEFCNGDIWRYDVYNTLDAQGNNISGVDHSDTVGKWRVMAADGTGRSKSLQPLNIPYNKEYKDLVKARKRPAPRSAHATAVALGMMFIFGGDMKDGSGVLMLADVWRYDPFKDSWFEIHVNPADMPRNLIHIILFEYFLTLHMRYTGLSTYNLHLSTRSNTKIDEPILNSNEIKKSKEKFEFVNEGSEPRDLSAQSIDSCMQHPGCRDPPKRYRHSLSWMPLETLSSSALDSEAPLGFLLLFGGESVTYAYHNDIFGLGVYGK